MMLMSFIPLFVIAVLAIWMIEDPLYEDALWGRIALVTLFSVGAVGMTALYNGHQIFPNWLSVAFLWATAIFLTRHVFRFLQWRFKGKNAWKKVDPETTQPNLTQR